MYGFRITKERERLGLTQAELANKLNISQKSISKYERSDRRPSYETLIKMSSLFGVSVDYLLGNDLRQNIPVPEHESGGFSHSINHWIAKTGLSYKEVADKLEISENTLMNYIDYREAVPYSVLIALSEICDVSTDCLLGLTNNSRERDLDNKLPFQYDYQIADRLRKLCNNSIGTNYSFLENLLALSSQEIYYMIEYGFIPHINTILQLSNYFNVSTDYLLCKIDEQEEKMLSSFKPLNEDNKYIIIGEAKKLIKEQRYEESVAADEPLKKTGTTNSAK